MCALNFDETNGVSKCVTYSNSIKNQMNQKNEIKQHNHFYISNVNRKSIISVECQRQRRRRLLTEQVNIDTIVI